MELRELPIDFSVCQVEDYSDIDLDDPFTFIATTDEERSLVCPTDRTIDALVAHGHRVMRP